ncbi:MAG TPA: flagellar hook capping FlgD N-terminal domain-containing protein [Steroidobacteraceae bacterium]|nr:flagellar hook capping FlgD N-terminal domain-containing protein [Steroidobacteraceae bacterium]HRX89217.1 flagellar hook capping FlgD N-terminal domain-containing protein [Steroidobacteraceae bacterium]
MDQIESLTGLPGVAGASATARARQNQLDQDSFLKLMIAQLKNQDPLKPLDPTAYVSQLAQFSSVSGLQAIEQSVSELAASLRGNQVLDGAALVGRSVVADGDRLRIDMPGSGASGAVEVPPGVDGVQLVIRDSSGQAIRSLALDTTSGARDFYWNGATDFGGAAPPGDYQFAVLARIDGQTVSLPTSVVARVGSVSIDQTNNSLILNTDNLGALPLTAVRRML